MLALRILDQDFALEPGRDYLLGAGSDCDFRCDGPNVALHHARLVVRSDGAELIDLGSPIGTYRNGARITCSRVEPGDSIQFAEGAAVVVRDSGEAAIVPIPALAQQAELRRLLAIAPPLPTDTLPGPVAPAAATDPGTIPPPPPQPGPGPGGRRFEEQSFTDTMAEELRRAPWLGLSSLVHGILFLLLYLLFPTPEVGGDDIATVSFDLAGSRVALGEDTELPPLEVQPEDAVDEPILELDGETEPQPVIEPTPTVPDRLGQMQSNPRITKRSPSSESRALRTTSKDGGVDGIGSAGFRKTVKELRETGLEIVFVFDSTGSMGATIRDTKSTIAEMLHVLRSLVPDARIGLVTYRDRGVDEDYTVRDIPLGLDFWQASNFVQGVRAEGGGDRPEAVRDGLRTAFQQHWRHKSKRVVVLAGDAPAHQSEWRRLMREVRAFTNRGNSYVHTLVTTPHDAGKDTLDQFKKIARAGRGHCVTLADHEQVLKRVLDFAFGSQFDGDLERVRRTLANNADRTDTSALALSRRGGSDLEVALRRQPVDPALLNALVRLPRRRVTEQLIRSLVHQRTPPHTRQAIAWVLYRTFDLPVPPIDPVTAEPPNGRVITELRRRAARLPG